MEHATLTRHVELPPVEPLDPAAGEVAVLHRVEVADPAEPVARRRGPEALAAGDGETLQLRGAAHLLEAAGFRHVGGQVAFGPARRRGRRRRRRSSAAEGAEEAPGGAHAGQRPHAGRTAEVVETVTVREVEVEVEVEGGGEAGGSASSRVRRSCCATSSSPIQRGRRRAEDGGA